MVVLSIELLLTGATLLLLLPVAVLCLEVVSAATIDRRRQRIALARGERPRLAVIIPAHNEASVIGPTIRSILYQLEPRDRLLVVADNCSDQTSTVAEGAGAEVITRTDTERRGKGFALDKGVRHLGSDAPSIVVVIDADCYVSPGSIDSLARLCSQTGRPVQALYLMTNRPDARPNTRIAEFAWIVKNQVRPAGLHRLGLPCQLMGSGMAFRWAHIQNAELASGHIVEDLKLGIDLARAHVPPLFCPNALVTSPFPHSDEGIRTQRLRWEHGYLGVMLRGGLGLLADSLLRPDRNLIAMALDLTVPPLALLTLTAAAVWTFDAAFYRITKGLLPLELATIAAALLVFSVLLSWIRYARRILPLTSLAFAGIYAASKIPLYAKFIFARQSSWVRSKRDHESP